ncbi:ankyrin repeat family protein [Favolaschia claudopus]|uniref:Ankyrin repeat family protein n=1 Tax=Favolaschia claudopus TaxID=2862362 RepID=A0AAW0C1T7_9AGAR
MASSLDEHPRRTFKFQELETHIKVKNFLKHEHRMRPDTLQSLMLSIKHPSYGEIGYISATRVQYRSGGYGLFLETMDVDNELFAIGSALFDKYGEIRPWLVDNEYHKGSGLWGRELNEGKLIIIRCVSVDPAYRKQGLGSWALQRLYSSEYVDKDDKILCWPSPIPRPPSEQWIPVFDGIVEFFRKAGYRRVGRTSFFAYSLDPEHPSRKLAYSDDLDPEDNFNAKGPQPRLALQDAIFEDKSEKVAEVIKDAYTRDPSSIALPDVHGFRPIFVAVKSNNLHAVRTLISLGLSDQDFDSRENGNHMTPLEACSADMCFNREFEEILVHQGWKGYSETSLLIKAALKRAMKHPMPQTDTEYVASNKWGCSCGKCYDGWLSGRTLIRLQAEADMAYDQLQMSLDFGDISPVPHQPLDPKFICLELSLGYIPKHLWPQLFKTFIVGYAHVIKAVAQLLSRPVLPTQTSVLEALQDGIADFFDVQAAKFFFNKGGRVEYAIAAIIHAAEASFIDLSGTDLDIHKDDPNYQETPTCANDREFALVRNNFGLDPTQSWGPYDSLAVATRVAFDSDSSEEHDEMDEEEEEDEDEMALDEEEEDEMELDEEEEEAGV